MDPGGDRTLHLQNSGFETFKVDYRMLPKQNGKPEIVESIELDEPNKLITVKKFP